MRGSRREGQGVNSGGPDTVPKTFGIERLNQCRSTIPAVTHVDYSARVQTVDQQRNPLLHRLMTRFHEKTGCPVLINTSFNIRSEPIVCTPEDAYRCFMATDMDVLVLGRHVLYKTEQASVDGHGPADAAFGTVPVGLASAPLSRMPQNGRWTVGEGLTIEINWHPDNRQVCSFGLTSLVALPLAAALWTHGSPWAMGYAAAIGGLLAAIGIVWPRGLRPLLVATNVVTAPLAWVVHDLVLSLAFFVVVVPVGLVFRLFGRDPLQLRIDRNASTYWQSKKQPRDVRSYFRRW